MIVGFKDSKGKFHPTGIRINNNQVTKRRQIGIVTGGVALGTAPKTIAQEKKKGTTVIGTPDQTSKKQKITGALKGVAKSAGKEFVQELKKEYGSGDDSGGAKIVVDPYTGQIGAKSGVLIDAYRAQALISARERNPNIIALALFNKPLVALIPEKQSIVGFIVKRNT